jgi:hypothetical protein
MQREEKHRYASWSTALAVLATACSGGGGDGPSGVFLDTVVSFVDYSTSGATAGKTTFDGRFPYAPGDTVQFSIGDVVLGSGAAAPFVTPVDLVPGALDETDETVVNIARFLQTLDVDLIPSNGLLIEESVHQAAIGVTVDFDQSIVDFEANEQASVDLLTAGLPGGARMLVPAQDAQDHLGLTLRTTIAGRVNGTFSGDDFGPFSFFVDRAGEVRGFALGSGGQVGLTGTATQDGAFAVGNVSGLSFTGTIARDGTVTGTWDLGADAGSLTGVRAIPVARRLDEALIDGAAGTYVGTSISNVATEPITLVLDDMGNVTMPSTDGLAGAVTVTDTGGALFRGLTEAGCEMAGFFTTTGSLTGDFRNTQMGELGTFVLTRQ